MSKGLVATILLLISSLCTANKKHPDSYRCTGPKNHPDLNPKLGIYQDTSKQFPISEPWYVVYRNFKKDPVFGTSKCVKYSPLPQKEDGAYPTIVHYGKKKSEKVVITLDSSEGYTAKNQIIFHPEGRGRHLPLTVYIAIEADECSVNRNTYVNEGACSVVVPESQLGKKTCCDFIYALLCGPSKYQVYDHSCKTKERRCGNHLH